MFDGGDNDDGGGSRVIDPIADIRAALGAALATSSSIASAEEDVSAVRIELVAANRAMTKLIHQHREDPRKVSEATIRVQQHAVEKIEARLGTAVAAMTAARENYAPKFAKAIAPLRKEAGEAILEAVGGIERAAMILAELEKFAVRHGLPISRLAHGLRPADLRRLGERLLGGR